MEHFDIIILGGGPGGYVAAIKAGQSGKKVALIEKDNVGGVCLNWGCIPTKAMLKTAKVYKQFMNAEAYGLDIPNKDITIDLSKIKKRKDKIVLRLTTGVKGLLKKAGVTVYEGFGVVVDKNTVEVNHKVLHTTNLILATGAHPFIPNIEGLDKAFELNKAVTSKELLDLDSLPPSLVIIGGGVIGVEFATLYSNLGSKVTIIEQAPNLLSGIDDEIRKSYIKLLRNKNLKIVTDGKVTKINESSITYIHNDKENNVEYDKVLISIGTRPNLKGLENLHLKTDKTGVVTNNKLETSIPSVYAIGDINGKMMLAHVASAEGIVAVENILGTDSELNYNRVPYGIYGFPEIAYVGLTEQDAKAQNLDYKVSVFPLAANGKALAEGESDGFIKIIADKKYGELIGIHILAVHATDMISEAVTTMELEGTVFEIAKAIHPHPTLSEIVMEAAHGIIDKPIHM